MPEIVKFLSGIEHEFQLGEEHFGMEPDATIEVDQVAIKIIEHLVFRSRLREQNSQPAGERLDICVVRRDEGQDFI
jgi:hypothetical protein